MKIALGADHGGVELKEKVKSYLEKMGLQRHRHEVKDMGNDRLDPVDDFTDFAHLVASAVSKGEYEMGILFCTTGGGMCIAANRYSGIRAIECRNAKEVEKARSHNGMNILVMGSEFVQASEAERMVDAFLSTEALDGKYERRRQKIDKPCE